MAGSSTIISDTLYLVGGSDGFAILDITDPANPAEISVTDTPDYAHKVAVSENIAYVADGLAGLTIFDISSPSAPEEIASVTTSETTLDVLLYGDYAVLAEGEAGVKFVDVSDPNSPETVLTMPLPPHYDRSCYWMSPDNAPAQNLAVKENYLYISYSYWYHCYRKGWYIGFGTYVYEIQQPVGVGLEKLAFISGFDLEIEGDFGYVSGENSVTVYNLSVPFNPKKVVGPLQFPDNIMDLSVSNNRLFVAAEDAGLYSLQWGIPSFLPLVFR